MCFTLTYLSKLKNLKIISSINSNFPAITHASKIFMSWEIPCLLTPDAWILIAFKFIRTLRFFKGAEKGTWCCFCTWRVNQTCKNIYDVFPIRIRWQSRSGCISRCRVQCFQLFWSDHCYWGKIYCENWFREGWKAVRQQSSAEQYDRGGWSTSFPIVTTNYKECTLHHLMMPSFPRPLSMSEND